tara:strand:+ start:420 stop:935 length:516 start_codon:yes stop_codon:yes gene_type:complete
MTVQINFSNKTAYTLIAIAALIIISGIVYALGSDDFNLHGHDAGEIEDSGSGGYYVPSEIIATTTTHNGNLGGFKELNYWIQTNGCSGYHVCDSHEITRYIMQNGSNPPKGWVVESTARDWHKQGAKFNDCGGWQSTSTGDSGVWGSVWDPDDERLEKIGCDNERAVLCCK